MEDATHLGVNKQEIKSPEPSDATEFSAMSNLLNTQLLEPADLCRSPTNRIFGPWHVYIANRIGLRAPRRVHHPTTVPDNVWRMDLL